MPGTPESHDPQQRRGQAEESSPGEFTQIFASGVPPAAEQPKAEKPQGVSAAPSEFTQIFTPIAPPKFEPQPLRQAQTPVAQPGEFTQFFSAISARQPSSQPLPTPPSVKDADATAVFDALDTSTPLQVPAPSKEAGAFTQLFQQIQAPPSTSREPLAPPPASQPAAQPQISQPHPTSRPSPPSATVFGAPPPQGSFTDIFQAQPQSSPLPFASGQGSQAGGFTDIFQPVSTGTPQRQAPPLASSDPFAAFAQAAPQPRYAQTAAPTPPAYPAPAPPVAAAGDFTRLMQSLEHGASASQPAQNQPSQPQPVQGDPSFFSTPYSSASTGGESEYTRVLRGGSLREQPSGSPSAAPASGSSIAPGLAIAPPKQEKKDETPGKKLSPLVLLLIVMNVLLVIVLIVVAILFLHRR